MADYALLFIGLFKRVLDDISEVHRKDPDQSLFLQPYSSGPIAKLRDKVPSVEAPVMLFASTSDARSIVSYAGEIVDWEDKSNLSQGRRDEALRMLKCRQPNEKGGLYNNPRTGEPAVNLLSVRRLVELDSPFSVGELTLFNREARVSTNINGPRKPIYVLPKDI